MTNVQSEIERLAKDSYDRGFNDALIAIVETLESLPEKQTWGLHELRSIRNLLLDAKKKAVEV